MSQPQQPQPQAADPNRKLLNLRLKKFDMSRIKARHVVVMIGKRETGKSYLVRDLLWHNQDVPVGTVISGTEGANQFYSRHIPSLFIHEEYSPMIIANMLKRQKLIANKISKDMERTGTTNVDPRTFLILDDCLFDASWTRDKNIRYLFMNGRHVHALFIITMQYALGVPPALRTNVDFVFILREPYLSNRKRIFDNYGSAFPSFEFFCQIMDQCTQNYECLVLDNTTQSNKLEDIIFWYKAEFHGDVRIGAPEFWAHSAANMREKGGSNEYDPRAAARLKGPAVSVRKI